MSREIGSAKEIAEYIIHIEGKPIEQALAIKDLLDKGYSQKDIAKMLGWSQSRVSQRLALLKLHPKLIEKALEGKISKWAAWNLAHLPQEEQLKYIDKDKITSKEVHNARRKYTVSQELISLLSKPIANVEPDKIIIPYKYKTILVNALNYYGKNHPNYREQVKKILSMIP